RDARPTLPGRKTLPGIIPSFDCPGVITPGVLGPTMTVECSLAYLIITISSLAGIPSVMITTGLSAASIASIAASLAQGAATKTTDLSRRVASFAVATGS